MPAEPVVTKLLNEVMADRRDDRRLSAGVRACRTRSTDFSSIQQSRLAGLAMIPETRDMLTRKLTAWWDNQVLDTGSASSYYGERELVIGGGLHAAIYAACRVRAGHAPPIVVEAGNAERIGGAFAVSLAPVFRLNSRSRPGQAGLPDQDKALNSIPGGMLQPAMVSSEEYMDNALMAWLIRLTLAQNADVYPNTRVETIRVSSFGGMTVETNAGTLVVARVIDARGSGNPTGFSKESPHILTFEQLMQRMGRMFPLRGMRQVAVIGGGDSARCAVESLLGIAPNNTSAVGLDYVNQVDWYTELPVNGSNCDDFRNAQRGRYIRLAQYLEGNASNPSTRLRVMRARGYATPMPDGALVNARTYDAAIECTGLALPQLDDNLAYYPYSSLSDNATPLGRKAPPYESYRVGPAANLSFSEAELEAGIARLPATTRIAMFRLAPRTAAMATMLD